MAYSVPRTDQIKGFTILQGLQASSATRMHTLGQRIETTDGKEFQYVYMKSSGVVMYTGAPMVWTTGDHVVTPDVSDSIANEGQHGFAGIAPMTNIDVNLCWGWVQTGGRADSCAVATTVAINEAVVCLEGATNSLTDEDSVMDSTNDSTFQVVGFALSAAAAGVADGYLSTASIMLRGNR